MLLIFFGKENLVSRSVTGRCGVFYIWFFRDSFFAHMKVFLYETLNMELVKKKCITMAESITITNDYRLTEDVLRRKLVTRFSEWMIFSGKHQVSIGNHKWSLWICYFYFTWYEEGKSYVTPSVCLSLHVWTVHHLSMWRHILETDNLITKKL